MLSLLILWALSSQQSPPGAIEQERKLPVFQQYRVAQIYRGKPATPVLEPKKNLSTGREFGVGQRRVRTSQAITQSCNGAVELALAALYWWM
jgi:hypothetical protein